MSSSFNKLFQFDGYNGLNPFILNVNGIIYGVTNLGGINYQSGVDYSGYGTLYGTTLTGGNGFVDGNNFSGNGTVFSYNLDTQYFNTIYYFLGGDYGYIPLYLINFNGKLYGTTNVGGNNGGYGTIFSLTIDGVDFTVLYNFNGIDGFVPNFLTNINGLLYGTTGFGGSGFFNGSVVLDINFYKNLLSKGTNVNNTNNGYGTIFSYNPSNGQLNTLFNFDGINNGSNPFSLLNVNANLYGITNFGGLGFDGNNTSGNGTLFKFNPLYGLTTFKFNGTNGTTPVYLLNDNGILYGTTLSGGKNQLGTLFSYNTNNSILNSFYNFNGMDSTPVYLIKVNEILFGTTRASNVSNSIIFSYSLQKSSILINRVWYKPFNTKRALDF